MTKRSKLTLLLTLVLTPLLIGASMSPASARRYHRRAAVHHYHSRAVGPVVPIVAGSSKVGVDSSGQVITQGQP